MESIAIFWVVLIDRYFLLVINQSILLCISVNFLLDAIHCEFYIVLLDFLLFP